MELLPRLKVTAIIQNRLLSWQTRAGTEVHRPQWWLLQGLLFIPYHCMLGAMMGAYVGGV